MHFEREAREIVDHVMNKDELNNLFIERRSFALDSIKSGRDHSISIAVINNKIKTLLCLR